MNCQIIASDIFDFAELLVSHNLIQDAKSLYDASARLQKSQNPTEWKYECRNLKFSVEGAVAGTIPQQINFVEILFNISTVGIFSNGDICRNPLSELNFDIEIEGFRELEDKIDNYFASWHLDKHINGGDIPSYIHPEYHLTLGGNRLEEKGVDNFGSTLILPSPRISYPPMDVILGIDFVLQNYFPMEKISKLLDESRYKEIVLNSQQRLWKPYYSALSSVWNMSYTTFEQGFEHFNLNPHISQL